MRQVSDGWDSFLCKFACVDRLLSELVRPRVGWGLPCRMFFPRRKRYACESMKETKCSAQLFMAQQMTKELKSSGWQLVEMVYRYFSMGVSPPQGCGDCCLSTGSQKVAKPCGKMKI